MNFFIHKFAVVLFIGVGCSAMGAVVNVPELINKITSPDVIANASTENINNIGSISQQLKTEESSTIQKQEKVEELAIKKSEEAQKVFEQHIQIKKNKKKIHFLHETVKTYKNNLFFLKEELIATQTKQVEAKEKISITNNKIKTQSQKIKDLSDEIQELKNKMDNLKNFKNITKEEDDSEITDEHLEMIAQMLDEVKSLYTKILQPMIARLQEMSKKVDSSNVAEYTEGLKKHSDFVISYNAKLAILTSIYEQLKNNKILTKETKDKLLTQCDDITEQLLALEEEINQKNKDLSLEKQTKMNQEWEKTQFNKELKSAEEKEIETNKNILEKINLQKNAEKQIENEKIELALKEEQLKQKQANLNEAQKKLSKQFDYKNQQMQTLIILQNQLD